MRGIVFKAFAAIAIALGVFFTVNGVMNPVNASGCDTNSVIKCGVDSVSEMRSKYNSDYTKGTKNIYTGMGVTSSMVNNYKVVSGTIYKNGTVYVGSKKVADGAKTAGRNYLSGSTKRVTNGTTWYERSTQVSFVSRDTWKVYVFLDSQGRFVGAVMLDCGNPVKARNVVVPPKPVYVCTSLTQSPLSRTERSFTATASVKNGAKVKSYSFNFGDGTSQTTTNNRVTHDYKTEGTYTAKVTVNFTANGKTVSNTNGNCVVTVKVLPPELTEVCELETKQIITIEKKDFDSSKHSYDFNDCKTPIKVCELATKEIVTIDEKDFDETKYSRDLKDCEETPVTPPKTPETPPELPETGPADVMMQLAGVVSLAGASAYYVASRRG